MSGRKLPNLEKDSGTIRDHFESFTNLLHFVDGTLEVFWLGKDLRCVTELMSKQHTMMDPLLLTDITEAPPLASENNGNVCMNNVAMTRLVV